MVLLSNVFISWTFGEQNLVMKQSKSSKTDPHSPECTEHVPIQNVDAFYDAFTIKRRRHVH
jgi:predicted metalloendopeptidase